MWKRAKGAGERMMVPRIIGIVFGLLAMGIFCLEIQRNSTVPTMNYAAVGFRRRVRCLLVGKEGGGRIGCKRCRSS